MPPACLPERIHSFSCPGRNLHHRIARALIDFMEGRKHVGMGLPIQVDLVQDYGHRYIIHFAGDKKPVEERQLDLRIVDRSNDERTVEIGGDDMRLTRQIGGLADDIVAARTDGADHHRIFLSDIFRNKGLPLHLGREDDMVSHSHRIGRRASFQSYLSPEDRRKKLPLRQPGQQIMAARMLYNCRLSLYNHGANIVIFNIFVRTKQTVNMIQERHIDQALKAIFDNLTFTPEPAGLYDPLRYMMEIGGKRIRPRLCLTTYSLFKDEFSEEILAPAAAIEVFHSFTLIHDDIMDKADVRRGVPTVYRKWNENTAILSGDVMSIESYKLLAKAPAEALPQALELFSKTAAEVCEGQQYDMDFENMQEVPMDGYMKMIGLKTAVLIACAAKMGAIIAGASERECDLLYKFGYDVGLAFQVADDWLDTFGDPAVFGKAIGGDILNNKKTWLMIKALEKASGPCREALYKAMEMPVETEEQKAMKIAAVKGIYDSLEVGDEAKAEIIRLHEQAMGYVAGLGLSGEAAALLHNYAAALIGRKK